MGRCKTCKHWSDIGFMYENSGPFRGCDNEHMRYGYHFKKSELPLDYVVIENDVGWGMLTGPEFGCVHYEFQLLGF